MNAFQADKNKKIKPDKNNNVIFWNIDQEFQTICFKLNEAKKLCSCGFFFKTWPSYLYNALFSFSLDGLNYNTTADCADCEYCANVGNQPEQ